MVCYYSNESYQAVFGYGTAYYAGYGCACKAVIYDIH